MPSPEATPDVAPQVQSEVITVPEWTQTEQESNTGPKFDYPAEPPVAPDNGVDDLKIKKMTIIDAQGTGEVREVFYGPGGPIAKNPENLETSKVLPLSIRNLAKRALSRVFGSRER